MASTRLSDVAGSSAITARRRSLSRAAVARGLGTRCRSRSGGVSPSASPAARPSSMRARSRKSFCSRAGWWLAQLARLIGGPLPTGTRKPVPMIVTVTEDVASGGQIWTRICARSNGFPQVIHSAKRFIGPTGLEEYIGCGIGMALRLSVEHEGAVLPQRRLFPLHLGKLRLRAAGLAHAGRTDGEPHRSRRRPVSFHARRDSSPSSAC